MGGHAMSARWCRELSHLVLVVMLDECNIVGSILGVTRRKSGLMTGVNKAL